MSRYDLTDFEWRVIEPLLPNKPRGVPRVNDRRVLNGIFWVLRSGAPWRDLPERYGPRTTCYNRFVRWRKAGAWDRMMDAIAAVHDGNIQMIDSTSVRAHQQVATAKRGIAIIVSVAPKVDSRPKSTRWSGQAHDGQIADTLQPSRPARHRAGCVSACKFGSDAYLVQFSHVAPIRRA